MFSQSQSDLFGGDNIVSFPTDQEREEYQLDDGQWFQLNRKIFLDLFCKSDLTRNEIQIISSVILLTYGLKKPKPMAEISASDISVLTGLTKSRVWQAISKLIARNVLKRNNELLGYNKYNSTWLDKKEIKPIPKSLLKSAGDTTCSKVQDLLKSAGRPAQKCRSNDSDSLYSLKTGDNIVGATPTTPPNKKENKSNSDRGARISEDWETIPDEWKQKIQKILDDNNSFLPNGIDLTAISFVNYWQSATGAKAKKKDWYRTWVNWATGNAKPKTQRFGFNKQAQVEASNRSAAQEWLANKSKGNSNPDIEGEVVIDD